MATTWPRESLGLGEHGIEVDDARDWLARISATILALARAEAGWVARTEDFDLACALAERAAEDVDSADLLFKRQYGLRAFPHEMARDSRIVPAWIRDLATAPSSLALLVGLSRVVKPWLIAECRRYRSRTAPNADGPTLRQIRLIEPELEHQIAWGAEEISRLVDADPASLADATTWATDLERWLVASGGFFGESARSDRGLWGSLDAVQQDVTALRQLAAVVYAGSDLPWDALLGLAKHLGDFGRHARRAELSGSAGDLPLPSDAPDLLEQMSRLASLLDACARQAEATGQEPQRYLAASARAASAHSAEWAKRLANPRPQGSANGKG
jgi:hypothetical protein